MKTYPALIIRCSRPDVWWYAHKKWRVYYVANANSDYLPVPSLGKGWSTPCIYRKDIWFPPKWLQPLWMKIFCERENS